MHILGSLQVAGKVCSMKRIFLAAPVTDGPVTAREGVLTMYEAPLKTETAAVVAAGMLKIMSEAAKPNAAVTVMAGTDPLVFSASVTFTAKLQITTALAARAGFVRMAVSSGTSAPALLQVMLPKVDRDVVTLRVLLLGTAILPLVRVTA